MKTQLILGNTDFEQWQKLIVEASTLSSIKISEDVETYLVFMLMRYTKNPWAPARVVTADFYESMQMTGELQRLQLRDVADRCVLMAGLWPVHVSERFVSVNYCVKIARSGYDHIASLLNKGGYQDTYQELTQHVPDMVSVLSSTREVNSEINTASKLIAAWDEYLTINPSLQ